jgi:hypothetical protein
MSQEWFDMWIGITRSLLAMVEAKKRSLPTKTWTEKIRIKGLWQAFEKTWIPNPPVSQPSKESGLMKKYLFEKEILKLKIEGAKTNIKLKGPALDYPKTLAFFENVLANNPNEMEQFLFKAQISKLQLEQDKEWEIRKKLDLELKLLEK